MLVIAIGVVAKSSRKATAVLNIFF